LTETLGLYRGISKNNAAGGRLGDKWYSPDPTVAARYGNVARRDVSFYNKLDGDSYENVAAKLGLPPNATPKQLVERARAMGYDGLEYVLPDGEVEFVNIPPRG
jgi:hypothetical protein